MKPLEMNDLANVKTLDREEMIKCTGGCKEPYEWEKISLPADLLASYEGVYESEFDKERIITFEDGKLFSMRTGRTKYEIYPFEKDKFFFEDGTTVLHFNRKSKNEITSVIAKSTGYDIEWKKTDKPIPSITEIELDASMMP